MLLLALCLLAPAAFAEEAAPMEVSIDDLVDYSPEEWRAVDTPALPAEALTDSADTASQAVAAPALEAGVAVIPMTGNTTYSAVIGQTCRIEVNGVIQSCKSSKAKVATVTDDGMITAIAAGKAKITVKLAGNKKYKLQLTVTDPTIPTGISIDQGSAVQLDKSETLQLTYALAPATAASDVTWKSSKKKVASVSATGLVTPLKAGDTTITVKTAKGKKSAKIKVHVVDAHAPVSVSIDQGSGLSLNVGESVQLVASATSLQGPAVTTYTWSSNKKKIATVSDTGLVTALKAGTVKITVKTDNKKKATITLKVGVASPSQPVTTGRFDLYPYLRKELVKSAQELGLRSLLDPNTDVGEPTYGNDCFNFSVSNYSSMVNPSPIENIWLGKDPGGNYCVDGFYLGMNEQEVEALIIQKGYRFDYSSMDGGVLLTRYVKGAYDFAFYYQNQTLIHLDAGYNPWDA